MQASLDLPTAMLTSLFTDWLDLDSLLALDSACCSASSRKAYFDVIGSSVFCLSQAPYPHALNTNGMRWFVARDVRVARLSIVGSSDVDMAVLTAFMHVSGASLETFLLSDCKDLATATAVLGLLSLSARRLETVMLIDCDLVDCTVFGVLTSTSAHSLRRLRLHTCSLTVPLSAKQLPDLHMLHISKCSVDLGTLCKLISASPSLRSFSCDDLYGQDACLDALAAHCPLLQILAYAKGDPSDVSSLVRVFQCCPDIELVDITTDKDEENSSATDAHIATIMQHCRKLKAFSGPGSSTNITDAAVMAIASRLEEMQHLWLYACSFQSDQPLLALSEHCRNLKTLSLYAIEGTLSEEALVAFVGNLHSIVELSLDAIALTDRVLAAIAAYCPHLQILDLYNCHGYTEVGIAALARGCKALNKVCSRADDPFIPPIARLLWQDARPDLEFIHEADMDNIWTSFYNITRSEFVTW